MQPFYTSNSIIYAKQFPYDMKLTVVSIVKVLYKGTFFHIRYVYTFVAKFEHMFHIQGLQFAITWIGSSNFASPDKDIDSLGYFCTMYEC